MDEAERAIHDVLCVLYSTVRETRTVFGGGCSESLMAQAVQKLVEQTAGKEQHAIQSFANALRQLPTIMADNAGLGRIIPIGNIDNTILTFRFCRINCSIEIKARRWKEHIWS